MHDTYDALRRHAEKDLAVIRQRLDSGRRMNVNETHKLAAIAEALTRTMDNMDRLQNRQPYSNTNIGYNSDMRRQRYAADTADDADDAIRSAMDAINKILPFVDDDYDADYVNARRGRPRTTRRGVGRYTQVRRHVRRMPGAEMDSRYDDMDDDAMDYNDDMEARRRRGRSGRFVRGDADDMDDVRRTADEARRTADEARRVADEARRTMDNAYPNIPVMRTSDARYDRTSEADRYSRTDENAAEDRAHRPGPRG